jgi:hypothetical protein
MERTRSRIIVRCSGDISRSWRRADWRITGSVPWSTVSSGLAATIALKSGTLIFVTAAAAGAAAGEQRIETISLGIALGQRINPKESLDRSVYFLSGLASALAKGLWAMGRRWHSRIVASCNHTHTVFLSPISAVHFAYVNYESMPSFP